MVMWLYDAYIIYQMMGTKTRPSRTRKHHGPEGRTESKICVSRGRHVPSEISYKKLAIRFSRLAAGSLLAASLLPLRLLLRLLVSASAYWCLLLPAAACCSLLLPAAGAAAGGCCCCCCCGAAVVLLQSNSFHSKKQLLLLLCPQRHGPPGRGNTMALKDEWSPK